MLAKVTSGAMIGINAYPVTVEVDIAQGLPQFATVGLAEGAVKESKDRVKSAIKNSGYVFPARYHHQSRSRRYPQGRCGF